MHSDVSALYLLLGFFLLYLRNTDLEKSLHDKKWPLFVFRFQTSFYCLCLKLVFLFDLVTLNVWLHQIMAVLTNPRCVVWGRNWAKIITASLRKCSQLNYRHLFAKQWCRHSSCFHMSQNGAVAFFWDIFLFSAAVPHSWTLAHSAGSVHGRMWAVPKLMARVKRMVPRNCSTRTADAYFPACPACQVKRVVFN